jgi:hypothetical protein
VHARRQGAARRRAAQDAVLQLQRAACPQPPARPICFNCGLDVGSDDHPLRNCPQPKRTSGVCYAHAHGRCDRKNCKFEHGGSA